MSEQRAVKEAFQNGKALITYLMAGDPNLAKSGEYILAAQAAGADLIEVGIPFSDPVAEGEVIQRAAARALSAGATTDGVFAMVESIAPKLHIPLVFMTYVNLLFHYGYGRFFARCKACGVSGVILPDVPPEEQAEVKAEAGPYGVEVVSLLAPSSGGRCEAIAKSAEGFLYLVSSMGVTGVRGEVGSGLEERVAALRKVTKLPLAVGFGIATPAQAAHCAALSDGAIVGSALVKLVEEHGENAQGPLKQCISALKAGVLAGG